MTITTTLYFLFSALAHYILFFIFRAGGGRARRGAGRARLPQDPAGGGQSAALAAARAGQCRGEPRWLLPPLLHLGAPAAFGRERADGTIRVSKRGARLGRDSPGREWTSRVPVVSWREGAVPSPRHGGFMGRGGRRGHTPVPSASFHRET